MKKNLLETHFENSISVKQQILQSDAFNAQFNVLVDLCIDCFKNKGKILFCGNGGSAADAQHIAAELSGRFKKNRPPLYAEALHVNTSYLTAVANDFGFDQVYSRMVEACGKPNDILIAISTSGRSPNILEACKKANELNMTCIAWTGADKNPLDQLSKLVLHVPSSDTAHIQECHIMLGHVLCEQIENALF